MLKTKNIRKVYMAEKDFENSILIKEKFKQVFGVRFIPFLEFENEKIKKKTLFFCKRALKKQLIEEKEKWLGIFLKKEMSTNFLPSITIKWLGLRKEYGVFAKKDLTAMTYIGEYTGIVRKRRSYLDKRNAYCFEYLYARGEKSPFVIDAKEQGNHTRFINHSNKPNLALQLIFFDKMMHIGLFTSCFVSKDTELTYDYGISYWKKREKPID